MGPGRDPVVEAQPTLPGWLECSHRWGDMAAAPLLRTSQRCWTNDRGRCRIQLLCNVCAARGACELRVALLWFKARSEGTRSSGRASHTVLWVQSRPLANVRSGLQNVAYKV